MDELVKQSDDIEVSHYALSERHDMRPLVLRTALTYLELLGVLRQKTPTYAGYKVRLLRAQDEVLAQFKGEPGEFLASVFDNAKAGRIWLTIDPAAVAAAVGHDRARVVRALEVLEERGLAELTAADLRHRYERLVGHADRDARVADLASRFAKREAQEIERLAQVLALAERADCHTNALVAHFGEVRRAPCGHCVPCRTGKVSPLPRPAPAPPLPGDLDVSAVRALTSKHRDALGSPRQRARWLVGLTSPALTRAKLTRHALFGALAGRSFREVLEWCENGDR